jgi:small nuclear ribonucleoprotein
LKFKKVLNLERVLFLYFYKQYRKRNGLRQRKEGEKPLENKNPVQALKSFLNKQVYVKLKSNLSYVGRLDKMDSQMNLIISDTIEYEGTKTVRNLGKVIIRGNNILYVALAEKMDLEAVQKL